jgi:hypothetical protein
MWNNYHGAGWGADIDEDAWLAEEGCFGKFNAVFFCGDGVGFVSRWEIKKGEAAVGAGFA